MPLMTLFMNVTTLAVVWMGGRQILVGEMEVGSLVAFTTYIVQVLMSLMILSMVFVMLSMSIAAMKRVAEVLSEVPDIQQPKEPIHEMKDGSVEFSHVHFSYRHTGGEEVLV